MQWDETANAGFTTGKPWIAVNPNYTEINAKMQTADPNSVFHYYKKLIKLRKQYPVIVYGEYELLLKDSEELFVYTRYFDGQKLLVVCNFADQEVSFEMPEEFTNGECLISNADRENYQAVDLVKPYEAFVILKK